MVREGTLRLTREEREELQRISRSDDEPSRSRQRAAIILMSAEGFGAKAIGNALGVGKRTVRRTRRRWRREAFDGLYDAARPGRPRQATAKSLRLLDRIVRTDPRNLGFAFCHWTAPRLAEYLSLRTEVGLSEDRVRDLLKARGFVWRKTKLTIRNRGNPEKKGVRRNSCVDCRKRPCARERISSCGMPTEFGSTCCRCPRTRGACEERRCTSRR